MESKKEKMNIFKRIRKSYREFMFTAETVKKMEEFDKKTFKEVKTKWFTYLYLVLLIAMLIWCGLMATNRIIEKKTLGGEGEYLTKQLEGEEKEIHSGELTKYMVDDLNGAYIKIAQTKIGDEVAYSLVYRYDVIPEKKMTATKYFDNGEVPAILINGYPNVGYEEMGLKSEEEAYLATQLAIYQNVSNKQYDKMAIGEFSLDKISPSEEKYEEMVERVVLKAKEIYTKSIENPYKINTSASMTEKPSKIKLDDNTIKAGPFAMLTTTDEYTKKIMGSDFNPVTKINAKSYIENSNVKVIDENGKEISTIGNGEKFYVEIKGIDKAFSQVRIDGRTNYLYARIYETTECKKKYVTLEPKGMTYTNVTPIIHNMDRGAININFKTRSKEAVEGIGYYLYDENNQLLQDVDGYSDEYYFILPVGKYYITTYDVPKDYFIDGEKIEFEITKDQKSNLGVIVDSLKELQ